MSWAAVRLGAAVGDGTALGVTAGGVLLGAAAGVVLVGADVEDGALGGYQNVTEPLVPTGRLSVGYVERRSGMVRA